MPCAIAARTSALPAASACDGAHDPLVGLVGQRVVRIHGARDAQRGLALVVGQRLETWLLPTCDDDGPA